MYTRCPQCKTVHRLDAALVSYARGLVQCGRCGRAFSALSFLFDDWPSGQAHGPAKGPNIEPPVLGYIAGNRDKPVEPITDEVMESGRRMNRTGWQLATGFLILMTLANTAWTFRKPLMESPVISHWINQNGWRQTEQTGLLKDPNAIQLVSRDIHSHPTRAGILVLNLTFVNLAQRKQVFPDLRLTLLDAANQPVARRRLQPTEYLRPGNDISAGLATDVFFTCFA